MNRWRAPRLKVEFTASALADLATLVPARSRAKVRSLIMASLSHDPRNPRDRAQLRPDKELAFFVLHYDAYFRVQDGCAKVFRITPADEAARRRPPLAAALL